MTRHLVRVPAFLNHLDRFRERVLEAPEYQADTLEQTWCRVLETALERWCESSSDGALGVSGELVGKTMELEFESSPVLSEMLGEGSLEGIDMSCVVWSALRWWLKTTDMLFDPSGLYDSREDWEVYVTPIQRVRFDRLMDEGRVLDHEHLVWEIFGAWHEHSRNLGPSVYEHGIRRDLRSGGFWEDYELDRLWLYPWRQTYDAVQAELEE